MAISFYSRPVGLYPDMCDNVSEMIVRTIPKLSTNVKVTTNGDRVSLDSFDADSAVSGDRFKNFTTYSTSLYNKDIAKFWKGAAGHAYTVRKEFDDVSVKDDFSRQYETLYWAGCEYINSLEYDESYGMLAPLWLNDRIPDRFVIFKVPEPSYCRNITEASRTAGFDFREDILKKCVIIRTFDLTENTRIGSYIRRYRNQSGFPESPVTFNEEWISFNGIDIETGEFTSKKEHYGERFWRHDETVIETDGYITEGFERNGVVAANLMNIEFLFDDPAADEYTFGRYFGLYCDVIYDGDFEISKNALYNSENAYSADPAKFNIYSDTPFIADNPDGVIVPFDVSKVSEPDMLPNGQILDSDDINSVFCVEDINGNLHSISRTPISARSIPAGHSAFRIGEKSVDLDIFKGFVEKYESVNCVYENTLTPSSLHCEVKAEVPTYAKLRFFRIVGGSETILCELTAVPNYNGNDTDEEIAPIGGCDWDQFCGEGSPEDIAKAICESFNLVSDTAVKAYRSGADIYFISPNAAPAYNAYGVRLEDCPNPDDIITFDNENMLTGSNRYAHVKCSEDDIKSFKTGDYMPSKAHNGFGMITGIVPDFDSAEFDGDRVIFPKKKMYDILLDSEGVIVNRANMSKIFVPFRPSYCRLSFYPVKDFGLTSVAETTKYGDIGELRYESDNMMEYSRTLTVISGLSENSLSEITGSVDENPFIIELLIGAGIAIDTDPGTYAIDIAPDPDDPDVYDVFVTFTVMNGGYSQNISYDINSDFAFDTLSTTLNVPELTYLTSEYDRCYENYTPELMTLSKTQPWICGWVMKDGLDVREKPYRLNSNPVFGQYSFSPETTNFEPDPKCYNQEWMYIFRKPFAETGVNPRDFWSYIGINLGEDVINGEQTGKDWLEDKLKSVDENWFDVFFKRDHIAVTNSAGYNYYSTPDYMKKYSTVYGGTDSVNARTFFRGTTVEFLMKADWSDTTGKVDNNLDNLELVYGDKLNGYKFTSVCAPLVIDDAEPIYGKKIKVIRNDAFKTITLIQYIVKKYKDAVSVVAGITNPEEMDTGVICRSAMYNPCGKEAIAENENKKPVSVRGYGKLSAAPVPDTDDEVIITGINTRFLTDFEIYNPDNAVWRGAPYKKQALIVNDLNFPGPSMIYALLTVTDVYSDTEMRCRVEPYPYNPQGGPDIYDKLSQAQWFNPGNVRHTQTGVCMTAQWNDYFIVNVNYLQLRSMMNECVFASVKRTVNNTQSDGIIYELVDPDGTVHSSDRRTGREYPFAVKIIEPMENAKYEYMSLLYDGNWVTYGILPSHAAPMFRCPGRFEPLKSDVLYFTDPFIRDFAQNPANEDPVKKKFFAGSRHLNTCFDTRVPDFGIIHDLCFHRTNEINRNVFRLAEDEKPVYPVSNRFAIGHRDVQTFNSSWDPDYFTRTLSNTQEEKCHGTLAMKENKSFFGSKCVKTPDIFAFETFSHDTSDPDVVFTEKGSHVEFDALIEKKLRDTLASGLKNLFAEYINAQYSYGNKTTIDDDIYEYVTLNLLDLYRVTDIKLWIRQEPASERPYFTLDGMDMNRELKRKYKLAETHVMSVSDIAGNRFDKKIVFNTRGRTRYTFGLSVTVEKR